MRRLLFLLVVVSVVWLSCDDAGTRPVGTLKATTEASVYLAGETIRVVFSNGGTHTVRLASCCTSVAWYVDLSVPGGWRQVEVRGIPCPFACPEIQLLVDPEKAATDSLSLDTPGTYRLRVPVSVPDQATFNDEVVTNTFEVMGFR